MSKELVNYSKVLNGLKVAIKEARLRSVLTVNTQLLNLYWNIGNTIHRQESTEGWGTKIVDVLAKDLIVEFPDKKGFSSRNLRYMREFAKAYPQFPLLQAPLAQLTENKGREKEEINYDVSFFE